MKQLKLRALLLSLVAILFAATTADSFAQLTKIWDVDKPNWGGPVSFVSNKGKIANVNGYGLVDLNNGHVTFSKNNDLITLRLNYSGTRYFLGNWDKKELLEFDSRTNTFIDSLVFREYLELMGSDDSTMVQFDGSKLSLNFWNIYTNKLTDTFKIPLNLDSYSLTSTPMFSSDGRYVAFHIRRNFKPTVNNFGILDRKTNELIFTKELPVDQGFGFIFLNHSNIMVYQTEIQLPGDDKKYSYLRMYDMDKRTEVRDIKFPEIKTYIVIAQKSVNDRYLIYSQGNDNNYYIYDLLEDKRIKFYFNQGPIYLDDTLYVSSDLKGFKIDWNAVNVEDPHNPYNGNTIYPNPTTNSILLNVEPKYFDGEWKLNDLNGNVMLKGIILPNPQLQINLNSLPAQTYFLQLRKDNFTVTYQVVKQ